jgi:hypothetical protein
MKVKITATVTLETEVFPEDYAHTDGAGSDDAIIAFELQQMRDEPWESSLGEELLTSGSLSGVKIEKVEEASPAQEQAA